MYTPALEDLPLSVPQSKAPLAIGTRPRSSLPGDLRAGVLHLSPTSQQYHLTTWCGRRLRFQLVSNGRVPPSRSSASTSIRAGDRGERWEPLSTPLTASPDTTHDYLRQPTSARRSLTTRSGSYSTEAQESSASAALRGGRSVPVLYHTRQRHRRRRVVAGFKAHGVGLAPRNRRSW